MFPKRKRIVDPGLLETVRGLPCMACIPVTTLASEPHHLESRGSGGDDVAVNLLPLCHAHHREVHGRGLVWFAGAYPLVTTWLESAGWEFNEFAGKWLLPREGVMRNEEDEESGEEAREEGDQEAQVT